MFSQIRLRIQLAILMVILLLGASSAPGTQDEAASPDEEGFASVGDYPWVGWFGPLSDGLHGLRFGTGGFEVNRVMKEKGLSGSPARPYTLRFEGDVLGEMAELIGGFTTQRPSASAASLRVIQIRWVFRGLPQRGMKLFGKLDGMLASRYGEPVVSREDGLSDLETGAGRYQRLYYGREVRAWLELAALGGQQYALIIRMECPQLPDPEKQD
jgi:hypothetical protein